MIVIVEVMHVLSSVAAAVGSVVAVGVVMLSLLLSSLVFAAAYSTSHVVAGTSGVDETAVIDKLPSLLLLLLNTAAAASFHVCTRIAAITRTL